MKLIVVVVCAALLGALIATFVFPGRAAMISLAPPADTETPRAPDPARLEASEPNANERIVAAEPVPNTEAKPQVVAAEDAEARGWRQKYGKLAHNLLEREQRELNDRLTELSKPAFDECVRNGEYEVVGSEGVYTALSWQRSPVTQIRMPSAQSEDSRVLRITLDERRHPDLYALWRESLWMGKRMNELLELTPSSELPPPK